MKHSTSAVLLALAFVLCSGPHLAQNRWNGGQAADAQPQPAFTPLRSEDIQTMRDVLAAAPAQGLDRDALAPAELGGLLQSRDPVRRSQGQALLLSETARYAADVHRGRLDDAAFDKEWGMRPAAFDAVRELNQALAQNRLKAWLDDLPPPYLGYQQLIEGLKTYRDIVARGGWTSLPTGPSMKLGLEDPRVPGLKARLAAEDLCRTAAGPAGRRAAGSGRGQSADV
jgi:murein L,D-transpeptidase YcbB/YkuD